MAVYARHVDWQHEGTIPEEVTEFVNTINVEERGDDWTVTGFEASGC